MSSRRHLRVVILAFGLLKSPLFGYLVGGCAGLNIRFRFKTIETVYT
jgi:hypothetical protein